MTEVTVWLDAARSLVIWRAILPWPPRTRTLTIVGFGLTFGLVRVGGVYTNKDCAICGAE